MIDVSIIIVNYNTEKVLVECIESIKQYIRNINYEIIIVDNNSSDNSKKVISEKYPDVVGVFLNKNMGFSYANNLGLEKSKGEYILFFNPDAYLINDSISLMRNFLKNNSKCGMVGPGILRLDGKLQSVSFQFPDFKQQVFYALHFKKKLNKKKLTSDQRKLIKQKIPFEVDWLSAACLMIRKSIILEYGGFDENYFMYGEDVDLCKYIKARGWKIYCLPNLNIFHIGGVASNENIYTYIFNRYRSNLIYAKKYFSYFPILTLRLIVIIGLFLRILRLAFIKPYVNYEKKQRIKAYFHSILLWVGYSMVKKKN